MNYMQEALVLAARGKTSVAPNPLVGCIIERQGQIIGRGWHQRAGGPHAEIIALEEAGKRAQGANVYVTLEPCCHYGRTPPCVEALIAAQVGAVHIPYLDPNPLVQGEGVKRLQAAGIKVYIGEAAEQAAAQNCVFLHYMTTKLPYVVAKWAMSLDGKIALANGERQWLTGIPARKQVHATRCWLGAVLVGIGTILADDPQLTPYLLTDVAIPYRIIVDSKGRLPLTAKVLKPDDARTIVATTALAPLAWRDALLAKQVTVLVVPTNRQGGVALASLLEQLGSMGITGVLVEGGQQIFTAFLAEQLVARLHIYLAPKLLGGTWAPVAELGITQMAEILQEERVGDDMFLDIQLRARCLRG